MDKIRSKFVNELTVNDATHDLRCSHCIGKIRMPYTMKCLILKDMDHERVKLLVFGDRYWINTDHTKRVRYLPEWRIKPIEIHNCLEAK